MNDKKRVKAVCKVGCPWSLWGAKFNPKDQFDHTWQIKTFVPDHACLKDLKNRNMTSKWMAVHYLQKFMSDPTYSLTFLQQDVMTDFVIDVSLIKCLKAKQKAHEIVFGKHNEKYLKIYEYLNELRQTNVGSTTIYFLTCRLFKRMYVCLQSMKDEFKTGCKHMKSLDGCFLKRYYGGHLLVAIGIDENDSIYPLAYVVVES